MHFCSGKKTCSWHFFLPVFSFAVFGSNFILFRDLQMLVLLLIINPTPYKSVLFISILKSWCNKGECESWMSVETLVVKDTRTFPDGTSPVRPRHSWSESWTRYWLLETESVDYYSTGAYTRPNLQRRDVDEKSPSERRTEQKSNILSFYIPTFL